MQAEVFVSELLEQKARLREAAKTRRDAISETRRKSSAGRIATRLLATARFEPVKIASGYVAIGSEVDLAPLLYGLDQRGVSLCLPAVAQLDAPLAFRAWAPRDPLSPDLCRVPAPDAAQPEHIPELVLAPLLAFDRRGGRLGYGGGYFDRSLARLRAQGPVIALGVAFSAQEVDAVPCEPLDQRLDYVVTERELIVTAQNPSGS